MATPLLADPDREFESLYEEYGRTVYRYALGVLRNPADAEDITQTTFMNAFRAMKAGEHPIKPRNWLLTIAHNACQMRFVRSARRPKEVPLDDSVDQIVVPERERPNVKAVLDELAKLPFNQRSALVMRELEGRSHAEIAEILGTSVSAVETLIFRARRSMRLRRSALDALGAVQLPSTLESLFGGGAAATTGGVLAGGVVLKAAAVLAAGAVVGAAGYSAVSARKGLSPDRGGPRAVAAADASNIVPRPGGALIGYAASNQSLRPALGGWLGLPVPTGDGQGGAAASPPTSGIPPAAVPGAPVPPAGQDPTGTVAGAIPAQPPAWIPQPPLPSPAQPPALPVHPPAPPVQPPAPPPVPALPPVPAPPPVPQAPPPPAVPQAPALPPPPALPPAPAPLPEAPHLP